MPEMKVGSHAWMRTLTTMCPFIKSSLGALRSFSHINLHFNHCKYLQLWQNSPGIFICDFHPVSHAQKSCCHSSLCSCERWNLLHCCIALEFFYLTIAITLRIFRLLGHSTRYSQLVQPFPCAINIWKALLIYTLYWTWVQSLLNHISLWRFRSVCSALVYI